MAFDPTQVPRVNTQTLRGVFLAHLARRAVQIFYRGEFMKGAANEPSLQKQASFGAFSQETIDLELMLALPFGAEQPKPNSTEEIRIYADDSTFKTYRIVSLSKLQAADCYLLTLAVKKPTR
jgi:hypothetical protein